MAFDNVVKTLIDELKNSIQTQTVVGEPIVAGNVTIIPVSKVSFGFAAGGGEKKKLPGFGAGTGGGASIEPVAFIAITGDDVRVLPVQKGGKWVDKLLDPENYEQLNKVIRKILNKDDKNANNNPEDTDKN
ncbi:MAG: spore germination protein GerW family protein [Candidatus Muiribacteriota bacterium]